MSAILLDGSEETRPAKVWSGGGREIAGCEVVDKGRDGGNGFASSSRHLCRDDRFEMFLRRIVVKLN